MAILFSLLLNMHYQLLWDTKEMALNQISNTSCYNHRDQRGIKIGSFSLFTLHKI